MPPANYRKAESQTTLTSNLSSSGVGTHVSHQSAVINGLNNLEPDPLTVATRVRKDRAMDMEIQQVPWWNRRSRMERRFFLTSLTLLFITVGLAMALAGVVYKDRLFSGGSGRARAAAAAQESYETTAAFTAPQEPSISPGVVAPKAENVCMTPGCVKTAYEIIQNMDQAVDPCQDFYRFACGGFVSRTVIPDDRTRMSSFSVLGDELLTQVRMLLEEPSTEGESKPFRMARAVFKSCMDVENIERLGLDPIKQTLQQLGGWPVLEGSQWESKFDERHPYIWYEQIYKFRDMGYSVDYFVDFSVTTDLKNSSWRILDLDQPVFGMSREYLIKGVADPDVQVE